MARLPRLSVPGLPHHVIQRGNNRQAVFLSDADRACFLNLLVDAAQAHGCALHAFVLLDNHFHLLLTPSAPDSLAKTLQALGRRYVRYFNDTHQRSGTLWEGRYRSTVLDAQTHLLPCMVALDLHPVRAGLVESAIAYPWSSHAHYTGGKVWRGLTPPPQFWALGNTPFAREAAYAQLVQVGISEAQRGALTDATLHGWALGGAEFVARLQQQQARRVSKSSPGRPPKPKELQIK